MPLTITLNPRQKETLIEALPLLDMVARYLDCPEVTAIPFALSSDKVAARVRQLIEALQKDS